MLSSKMRNDALLFIVGWRVETRCYDVSNATVLAKHALGCEHGVCNIVSIVSANVLALRVLCCHIVPLV